MQLAKSTTRLDPKLVDERAPPRQRILQGCPEESKEATNAATHSGEGAARDPCPSSSSITSSRHPLAGQACVRRAPAASFLSAGLPHTQQLREVSRGQDHDPPRRATAAGAPSAKQRRPSRHAVLAQSHGRGAQQAGRCRSLRGIRALLDPRKRRTLATLRRAGDAAAPGAKQPSRRALTARPAWSLSDNRSRASAARALHDDRDGRRSDDRAIWLRGTTIVDPGGCSSPPAPAAPSGWAWPVSPARTRRRSSDRPVSAPIT